MLEGSKFGVIRLNIRLRKEVSSSCAASGRRNSVKRSSANLL